MSVAGALRALDEGGIVVYPTDTLWGLGARLDRPQALRKVFSSKDRPLDQALSVAVANADDIARYALVTPLARSLFALLPGPLSIVLDRLPTVPDIVTGGGPSVALRVPAHETALELLSKSGPLTCTSANRHGHIDPRTLEEARQQLGDRADYYLEAASPPTGAASTIVDARQAAPKILRPGALSERRIREHLRL